MASGHSYNDPVYSQIESRLEKKYGLTPGLMGRIRTRGERSNADQVSEDDARSVYQIIPSTRDGGIKNWGIDAYASKEGAAEVAALVLRDSKRRNGGDEDKAVLEYHGGLDRSQWGSRTRAYGERVNGRPATPAGSGYTPGTPHQYEWGNPDYDLNTRPGDRTKRPIDLGPEKMTFEERRQATLKAIGLDPFNHAQVDTQGVGLNAAREGERAGITQHQEDLKVTPGQRLAAGWQDGTVTAAIIRHFDDSDPHKPEEGYTEWYLAHRDEIEKGATDDELGDLRDTSSQEGLAHAKAEIASSRERQRIMATAPTKADYVLTSVVSALPDPVGIVAGEGWGKTLQTLGLGARAAFAEGRTMTGIARHALEQGTANVGLTGLMDLNGDPITTKDYVSAFAFGSALGVATSPLAMRGAAKGVAGAVDNSVNEHLAPQIANGKAEKDALVAGVRERLGPDATEAEVNRGVTSAELADHEENMKVALGPVPDNQKLLDGDNVLTSDAAVMDDVTNRHDLHLQEEGATRSIMGESIARAEQIVADNPIDESRLKPMTGWMGLQSTGIDLLKGKSVLSRAFGLITTEGTTGAGGRRRTAALIQHVRERVYGEQVDGYMGLYDLYRKQKGVGVLSEAFNGKAFKEFEREVFLEIENRADDESYIAHNNPLVREAADKIEHGMEVMRVEQQHVGTVGSARLGESSRGYIPHRIQGAKIAALTAAQKREVQNILSEQFQSEKNAFQRKDGTTRAMDKEFSDKLAAKYMREAMERAKGGSHVPMNLMDPQAADMIDDALEAMGVAYPERKDMLGKFSRGGAAHTKKRLRIDMNRDIGDGMKLADLYDTGVTDLYHGYARRVSGEVALAQYGIMGRKGLMELRHGIMHTGGTPEEIRAFDQVATEFLNMPFGDIKPKNHRWMDNARIAASLGRLGGMGFTQLSETGNAIAALGAQRMAASVVGMPRMMAEVRALSKGHPILNPILKSLDKLGGHIGLDEFQNTRLFDVPDKNIAMHGGETVSTFSRFMRAGGNLQARASGHRMIMATQVRGMAEQIVRKAISYAKKGGDDIALDDMGIPHALRERLRANMDSIATFKGGELQSLDLRAGDLTAHEIMSLHSAVERGASQIIQKTFIGETGKWAHDDFLKLLTQFRTFGLISVEKQWGRNKGNYGALRSFAYMVGSASFALPIHMARVQAAMVLMDDAKATDYYNKHMNATALGLATLNYASSAALLPDILDLGTSFVGGTIGMNLPDDIAARGQSRGGFIGGKIAPSIGLVNDLYQGATSIRKDGEWNPNGIKRTMKVLPGSNLPYVAPFVNQIGD